MEFLCSLRPLTEQQHFFNLKFYPKMEIQNVLHTEKVTGKSKSYYLDLKKAENGKSYLTITQSKKTEDETYERVKMILFEGELEKFGEAFLKIIMQYKSSEAPAKRITDEEIQELRKLYPRAYEPWTKEDDDQLRIMAHEDATIEKMSSYFQRKEGAIILRMKKLKIEVPQTQTAS